MRTRGVIPTALLIGFSSFPVWNGALAQNIIYVDQSASGANDGSSWTGAFIHLQDALAASQTGDELWVAAGTYTPDQGNGLTQGDRDISFQIPAGVDVYGGFVGTESSRDERDWETYLTILSGDLLRNDTEGADPLGVERADNSLHVVYVNTSVLDEAPVLDGIMISGGNATVSPRVNGGGLFIDVGSHASLVNLTVRDNFACARGGGLVSFGSFVLSNSQFIGNGAGAGVSGCRGITGGGLHQEPESRSGEEIYTARLEKVIFESNIAANNGGGALAIVDGPILVVNSTFLGNQAVDGGAVYNRNVPETAPAIYLNSRFLGNRAPRDTGGAMSIDRSAVIVTNSLFAWNAAESPFGAAAGGAISVYGGTSSTLSLVNSTIAYNSAPITGAIWIATTGSVEIWNTLIWGNTGGDGLSILNKSQVPIPVGYSIVEDGLPEGFVDAGGVQTADPRFVDPTGIDGVPGTLDDDFSLSQSSPAIDAGDNSALPLDVYDLDDDGDVTEAIPIDLLGNVRILDGGTGTIVVDIGSAEYDAVADGVDSTTPGQSDARDECRNMNVFPNPASGSVQVTLPRSWIGGTIRLEFYDVTGGQLIRLANERMNTDVSSRFETNVSGLSSGLYLIRAQYSAEHPPCVARLIVAN